MTEYSQLRSAVAALETLRDELVHKIETKSGDPRTLDDLHRRVSKALKALSCEG
ncbi:hypothetical protein [Mameliella sediminis]|uniref:hypothetical protein n=1 Tax=Mameliella sediminis TaxID=2836866 RepID=UPI001C479CEC|nr:hypothetical protein [Mameliella sediminis]MBY6115329.1 hypothetical protein [Antarctobacter heliothermus]MBY6144606.1 hypothetical protein [Mameliella alba]MBV7395720.1 hypothetical protein [Mameliella sediminis]MBY6160133.1 hypothetical protein [Mameliella alba]MBY6168603.1 hypothetical protein [Mameliella alba]